MTVQELREVLDQRFERLERDVRDIQEKLDKALELLNYQRGQQAFSARFWKHAAWIVPTTIALVALLKSFFESQS